MDEEVVLLEEQLAAAQSDIERLQLLLAEAQALASTHEAEATELRRQLGSAGAELEAARNTASESETRARAAAGRYREAVLARESDLPGDLVAGDSIEAIDESLARARQTVAQVRQHIEQEAQAQRVPAGAPVRGGPDLSSLSAAEKIRLGLQS